VWETRPPLERKEKKKESKNREVLASREYASEE
jgi:hypothetical protein